MAKSEQEIRSMELVKGNWEQLFGCVCEATPIPEGKGYDLECAHLHVEVKGSKAEYPGHRYFAPKSKEAADSDQKWMAVLVSNVLGSRPTFYRIPREYVSTNAEEEPQWILKLGKRRLQGVGPVDVRHPSKGFAGKQR